MGTLHQSVAIHATPSAVFRRLTDIEHLTDWVTVVISTDGAPRRDLKQGDIFRQRARFAGQQFETRWRVIDLERPRFILYEATGPAGSDLRMRQTVTRTRAGSRLSIEAEYTIPGGILGTVLDHLVAEREIAKEAERALANLKRLVEEGVVAAVTRL